MPTEGTITLIRNLASVFCTTREASRILGVNERTFLNARKKYSALREAWEQGLANAAMNLRRKQVSKAIVEGDTTMLIWLGKNQLGQTDRLQASVTMVDTDPIPDAANQQQAAERYAEIANVPPSLRLVAPKQIDLEAEDVTEVTAEAEMPEPTDAARE